jgi:hypothetical protein
MVEALRWLWWGLVYLLAVTVALVLIVGALPGLPVWARWAMLGVILWALALDARAKWTGEQT